MKGTYAGDIEAIASYIENKGLRADGTTKSILYILLLNKKSMAMTDLNPDNIAKEIGVMVEGIEDTVQNLTLLKVLELSCGEVKLTSRMEILLHN